MTGSVLSSEGLDARRRRLLFRSWHRGTREMDLVLGRFADACLVDLSDIELARYEALMEVPDPELFAWVIGELAPPAAHDTELFRRLRSFHLHRDATS